MRKLIQGIQGLRHLGVEGLVDPLPKIAVVGDQSTGKSSLIEGIRYLIHNSVTVLYVAKVQIQWYQSPKECRVLYQSMSRYSLLVFSTKCLAR